MQQIMVLMGPTACGKTALSLELAKYLPIEIINVDSALIYRELNIGSGKPSIVERQQVKHHLVDIKSINEIYSVADFVLDAKKAIAAVTAKGRIPLLVGGTMLYYHALFVGLSDLPARDEAIRQELKLKAKLSSWPALHQELQQVDARTAARLNPNDGQRIERALEVYYLTGRPLSALQQAQPHYSGQALKIAIMPTHRHNLHQRIKQRLEHMLQQGLVEEVKQLLAHAVATDLPALRSVGYRQVIEYLQGSYDYPTMEAKIQAATRQLAKRQLTWMRSMPELNFLAMEEIATPSTARYLANLWAKERNN